MSMFTEASGSVAARFKIAGYNLQNLGREDNPGTVYDQKLEFLTKVLRRVDADVVAVAEIREEQSFHELVDMLDVYPEWVLGDAPTENRRIQTGLITRLPIVERGQWHVFPAVLPAGESGLVQLKFRRPVPWIRVRLANDETVLVAAVHLKSGRPEVENVPESETPRRRELLGTALATAGRAFEAAGLRCCLDDVIAAGRADHYAVLGDFNDGPGSEQLRLVRGRIPEAWGGAEGNRGELFPVSEHMPAEDRVSYVGWGRRELLDHILVSAGLEAGLRVAGVETDLLADIPLDGSKEAGPGYPRSDHVPIWAEFELGTATPAG